MADNGFELGIDELTLAGARRGDVGACERIYRTYQAPAYTVAARICRCRETAQEVTQEAFISAFRRIRQFRGDAPFWGWLRRVVVNHAISALRKQPSAQIVEFEDYQAPVAGQQENLGQAMDLEKALAQLEDLDRAIVWLHDVEGYKHHEIATLFDRTESFSKSRLTRARTRLRDLIQAAEHSPQGRETGMEKH